MKVLALVLTSAALAASAADAAAASKYSQQATVRCLRQHGLTVGRVRDADARRRALGDVAQRNSVEARRGKAWVALVFASDASQARFVHELLVVPRDPYVLRVVGNVVLMYPQQNPLRRTALGCLRTR